MPFEKYLLPSCTRDSVATVAPTGIWHTGSSIVLFSEQFTFASPVLGSHSRWSKSVLYLFTRNLNLYDFLLARSIGMQDELRVLPLLVDRLYFALHPCDLFASPNHMNEPAPLFIRL